ncbi:MAG: hypothetical protein HFJ59_02335 [Clostridia bacterium]|nr:hypothetical protein [Clostridia bacterium]
MNNKCSANNEKILLSFKYSINNRDYTIKNITTAKKKCNREIENLFKKLEEITNLTWKELQNRPKQTGYETIPISEFNICLDNIKQDLNLSDDSKIIVFRFNSQKSRLLGVKSYECSSILYIIGYDWNFSAYNHGS